MTVHIPFILYIYIYIDCIRFKCVHILYRIKCFVSVFFLPHAFFSSLPPPPPPPSHSLPSPHKYKHKYILMSTIPCQQLFDSTLQLVSQSVSQWIVWILCVHAPHNGILYHEMWMWMCFKALFLSAIFLYQPLERLIDMTSLSCAKIQLVYPAFCNRPFNLPSSR